MLCALCCRWTPLHWASFHGHAAVVELILSGSDAFDKCTKNKDGFAAAPVRTHARTHTHCAFVCFLRPCLHACLAICASVLCVVRVSVRVRCRDTWRARLRVCSCVCLCLLVCACVSHALHALVCAVCACLLVVHRVLLCTSTPSPATVSSVLPAQRVHTEPT